MSPSERAGGDLATRDRSQEELDARAAALRALAASRVPFLVAGAYAFFEYTGIFRDTKDLDLFLRERDLEDAFRVLEQAGFRTELDRPGLDRQGLEGRVVRGPHLLVRQRRGGGGRRRGSSTRARAG